ncbi:MAG: hypothetical protein AM324_011625 [Candidatus Thorarchaeota archaeon SMTZ1-83]|nr:MAG: hypothetical protein AM324_12890 [Candidatus Thorarchaeota archaeon SMTZ1-83]
MDDESTGFARKVVAVPFVLIFMNSIYIVYTPEVFTTITTLVPILLLSIVVSIDIAIRPIAAKEDRFDRAVSAFALLLFPLMVSLPHFEWIYLTSSLL